MLPWRLQSRGKYEQVVLQLVLVSCLFHLICGIFIFFVYRQNSAVVHIYINQKMLHHSVPVMLIATKQEQLQNLSIQQPSVRADVAKSQQAHSIQKNMTRIAIPAKATGAKEKKKTKAVPKKQESKIVTDQQKNDVAKKVLQKKEEQKLVQGAEKKAPEKKIQSPEKNIVAQNRQQKVTPSAQAPAQTDSAVYATAREVELYRQQQLLTQKIGLYWKPPAGIGSDCACQVTFTVDWSGQLADIGITQSSGILIFDLAARSALCAMEMPEWAKGKTFTVVLHNTEKGAV